MFQAPSLDRKLTVAENLRHQGALYGLSGSELRERRDEMLAQFGLSDRAGELTEKLSGGLRRRVELAKGLLHRPRLLLARRAEHRPRSRRPQRPVELSCGPCATSKA